MPAFGNEEITTLRPVRLGEWRAALALRHGGPGTQLGRDQRAAREAGCSRGSARSRRYRRALRVRGARPPRRLRACEIRAAITTVHARDHIPLALARGASMAQPTGRREIGAARRTYLGDRARFAGSAISSSEEARSEIAPSRRPAAAPAPDRAQEAALHHRFPVLVIRRGGGRSVLGASQAAAERAR